MTRLKKRILIAGAAVILVLPAATFADIVFDPTNFAEAVLQVADDVQMVDQLYQEVTNEVAMLKSWNFTQLPGILQSMNVWQQVFGQAGSTYTSTDPGSTLNSQYPSDPNNYANMTDASYQSMQTGWDQEERSVLIENRTVQNQTYLNLQPTAQRIQSYVEHSNSASGATSAMQAGNEEVATLVAQLQALQAQEITDARAEVQRDAQAQAEQPCAGVEYTGQKRSNQHRRDTNMSFPNMTTSYGKNGGSGETHNPYARAAAAWDDRIGSARVQARNWRYIAFASMALALISTSGAVVLGIKKQVATYIVEVDKAGMPGRITLASQLYQPATAQIGYFVGEVVRLVRERPLDPVVMRQQWTKAYQFLAGQAVNGMNEYAASDTGMKTLPGEGATARTVEVSSILQKANDTFQVRWVETTYSNGMRRSREEYTGLFQVKLIPPRDESDSFKNPIGVYITNFTWSREFSGAVMRDDALRANPNPPSPNPNNSDNGGMP